MIEIQKLRKQLILNLCEQQFDHDKSRTRFEDELINALKALRSDDANKSISVVLTAYKQTGYEDYTHVFKIVNVDVPDDVLEWHVAGEKHNE